MNRFTILKSTCAELLVCLMLSHNFCRSDGRLVKLFLFSTLLDKSPLTSIYFATFEKKRKVNSPLPTQSKFLVNYYY